MAQCGAVQGPMHLVTDPMTQDAKLVPLWRAMYVPLPPSLPFAEPFAPSCRRCPRAAICMYPQSRGAVRQTLCLELTGAAGVRARYADMSAQGETPKVETPDDWKIPGWN